MKTRQKRMAAALAAVDLYLREEAVARETPAPRLVVEPGAWAQAGRLDAMNLRCLMQHHAFARGNR
ncbi:MAG: hypothetical protein LBI62_02280 [Candidatus Accumulibacter sp.]|jgi:hypothetical protein|nr:hypothetical protein [Accumulibacter sp.]